MSDSVGLHRWQPTRLPRPWDSPGKNTGVGCHFLLQCMKVKSKSEVAQSCLTLSDPMGYSPTRLLCPWDFPGKSTGVGCHCLLRIIIQYYFIHFVAQTYSDLVIGNCFRWLLCPFEASLVAHTIKSLPVVQETQV